MTPNYYIRFRGKISGPFSVEQLKRMANRGQFSKMHQVSLDQRDWGPATELSELFSPIGNRDTSAQPSSQSTEVQEQWFYAVGDRRIGPTSRREIVKLLKANRLTRETLVWKDGMLDWLPAELVFVEETEDLEVHARHSSVPLLWIATSAVLIVASIGLAIWFRSTKTAKQLADSQPVIKETVPTPTPTPAASVATTTALTEAEPKLQAQAPTQLPSPPPSQSQSEPKVTAMQSETPQSSEIVSTDFSNPVVNDQIKHAVGMVVCYLEINLHDGSRFEKWLSHGSCFVVNESGYAITNQHVVQDHAKSMNATPEGRIAAHRIRQSKMIVSDLVAEFGEEKGIAVFKASGLEQQLKTLSGAIASIIPHCVVYFGTKGFPCKVEYISNKFDMSVIRIDGLKAPAWFSLSKDSRANNLANVIALGFPGTAQYAFTKAEKALQNSKEANSFSKFYFGTSSHLDVIKESAFSLNTDTGAISVVQQETGNIYIAQHSATIRPGNSGGPLVFSDHSNAGAVYAINTLFLRDASPVYVAFPIAQMRSELEDDAKVPNLKWR